MVLLVLHQWDLRTPRWLVPQVLEMTDFWVQIATSELTRYVGPSPVDSCRDQVFAEEDVRKSADLFMRRPTSFVRQLKGISE